MSVIFVFFGILSFVWAVQEFSGRCVTGRIVVGLLWVINGLSLLSAAAEWLK